VIISFPYRLYAAVFGCLTVLARRRVSKDAELLVLRHENAVLRLWVPITALRTVSWPRSQEHSLQLVELASGYAAGGSIR
jgi:hypothetical protein